MTGTLSTADINKMKKNELIDVAKTRPGYDPQRHTTMSKLRAFLLGADVPENKKDVLLNRAKVFPDFVKSRHGRTIKALEDFLKSKEGHGIVEKQAVVAAAEPRMTRKAFSELDYNDLWKLAKKHGYTDTKNRKGDVLRAFLEQRLEFVSDEPVGRLVVPPAAGEKTAPEQLMEWPVPADVLKKHSATIASLKKLLNVYGVNVAIPRTKKEIVDLFAKSRCSPSSFTCSDDEFCDLRNSLCRDLKIIRNENNEFIRFAKGFTFFDENNRRFYGTKDAIQKIRTALLEQPATPPPAPPAPVQKQSQSTPYATPQATPPATPPAQPAQVSVVRSVSEEKDGISPININHLLNQHSEKDMRKAILNILGLYNDIDPNDEIVS